MNRRLRVIHFLFALFCVVFTPLSEADNSQWGIGAGFAGSPFGMDNASQSTGGRINIDNHPFSQHWHNVELFFQGSATYYHSNYEITQANHHDDLWVFALAPVARYHIEPQATVDPFIDLSSGPGYLSVIYYENRNLGLHFTFQNMLGTGVAFGEEHQWSAELQIFHYSNAGISTHNRGFTSPVFLSMSYQL